MQALFQSLYSFAIPKGGFYIFNLSTLLLHTTGEKNK